MKQKVNVFDLSSVAKQRRENESKPKPTIKRSKDVYSCGGPNSSVSR